MSDTDTTTDTSTIDEKKQGSSSDLKQQIPNYLISVLISIILVFIYFSTSGLVLYLCKLAQSNILPTEPTCYPYTENEANIQEINTNIFITDTEPPLSMKLKFPYNTKNSNDVSKTDNKELDNHVNITKDIGEFNASYKFLEFFKNYKQKGNSGSLGNYFTSIIEHIITFTNSSINHSMNVINENFNELAIIIFGPIIYICLITLLLIFNQLYVIYLWFANLYWFFKINNNEDPDKDPDWNDVTIINPITFSISVVLSIIFILFYIFGGFIPVAFATFIIVNMCLITTFLYKSVLNNKQSNAGTIILETFKEYKFSIVTIISLIIIIMAFSKVNVALGICSLIITALIYYGFISFNLFKPIIQNEVSKLTNYKQAKKTCETKDKPGKKLDGILDYVGFFFDTLSGSPSNKKGGGDVIATLKQLGGNNKKK